MKEEKYKHKVIRSNVVIATSVENVWDKITNVEIEHFRFPWYFRAMNVPKPIRAEITREGVNGDRIAYFDNGKRFIQKIETWEKFATYSFSFNPEDGFRAAYFFDLFNGVFRITRGTYYLKTVSGKIDVQLKTDYVIRRGFGWLLAIPVYLVLTVFQKYLLHTIQVNAEQDVKFQGNR